MYHFFRLQVNPSNRGILRVSRKKKQHTKIRDINTWSSPTILAKSVAKVKKKQRKNDFLTRATEFVEKDRQLVV